MKEKSILYMFLGLLNFNLVIISIMLTIMLSNMNYYLDSLSGDHYVDVSMYTPSSIIALIILMVLLNGAVSGAIIYFANKK